MQVDNNARRREIIIVSLLAFLILLTGFLSWKYISGKNIDLSGLAPESTNNVVSGDEDDLFSQRCEEEYEEQICLTAVAMTGKPITKITKTTTTQDKKTSVEISEISGESYKSTTTINGVQTKASIKISSTLYTQNGNEKSPWLSSAAPIELDPNNFIIKPVEILDFNQILDGEGDLTFTESTVGRCQNQECIKYLVSKAPEKPDQSKTVLWINTETHQIVEITDESTAPSNTKYEFSYPQTTSILRPEFVSKTQ